MTVSLRAVSDSRSPRDKSPLAKLIERVRKRLDPNRGVQVRARLTYAIGKATIAMGDDLSAFKGLRAKTLTPPGLCIEVQNNGKEAVVIAEVGLTRGSEGPQISLREPHLHDSGAWPRRLEPGESVVAHFGSGLAGHRMLAEVRRSYAQSVEGQVYMGPEALRVLRQYQQRTAEIAGEQARGAA